MTLLDDSDHQTVHVLSKTIKAMWHVTAQKDHHKHYYSNQWE